MTSPSTPHLATPFQQGPPPLVVRWFRTLDLAKSTPLTNLPSAEPGRRDSHAKAVPGTDDGEKKMASSASQDDGSSSSQEPQLDLKQAQILANHDSFAQARPSKAPMWDAFSPQDSRAVELTYQKMKQFTASSRGNLKDGTLTDDAAGAAAETRGYGKVPVLEDFLFEVDILNRELYPVYWDGPVNEVKRRFGQSVAPNAPMISTRLWM
jgi:hypothetical protein